MPSNTPTSVDRRALKILFDTYWTSAGWRDAKTRSTPSDDFEYAKHAGVMFDEVQVSHDDIVNQAIAAVRAVSRRAVADAFVFSLASRRLELRSALGSFAVMQHLPRHSAPPGRGACPVCGEYSRAAKTEDLNVLNFERFKWGGVRHDQPLYAGFDLRLFRGLPRVVPAADDVKLLKSLLRAIEAVPAETTSASIEKHLAPTFTSNKHERDIVVGILGHCGILGTAAHPGYLRRFLAASDREEPGRRFVDMAYPACWWQRSDGINHEAVAYWFDYLM